MDSGRTGILGSVFLKQHGTNCDHSRCCDDPDDLFVCTL